MLATRRALVFAKELGFNRVIVEGDSANTITSINGGQMDHSALGHVLLDIKSLFFFLFLILQLSILLEKVTVWHTSLLDELPIFLFWSGWSLLHQTFLRCTNLIY